MGVLTYDIFAQFYLTCKKAPVWSINGILGIHKNKARLKGYRVKSNLSTTTLLFLAVVLATGIFIVAHLSICSSGSAAELEDGVAQDWFARNFSSEKELLSLIHDSLANGSEINKIPDLDFGFDTSFSHVATTLLHEGQAPIRWIPKDQKNLDHR